MRLFIANAFSLSMLDREQQAGTAAGYVPRTGDPIGAVARIPRPVENPREIVASWQNVGSEVVSIVGHPDTAKVLGDLLGLTIQTNRVSIKLTRGDQILVGQMMGPNGQQVRLPEGATGLPEDATIEWWLV